MNAGDIAIIGYNFDNPDEFSFVCLTSISSSTVIYFTDNGWKSDNTFRANEGIHTWTASTNYSIGDVVNHLIAKIKEENKNLKDYINSY